jgi:HEAT repeat protein
VRRHLPTPEGRIDARALLEQSLPNDCTPNSEAAALALLGPEIAAAATRAVQSSPDEARALSLSLLGADGRAAFQPLTQRIDRADPELAARAKEAVELIAKAVVEPYARLAEHPAADVRQSALRWLATRPEPAARNSVLGATRDGDATVQRAALTALGARPDAAAASAVADVLGRSPSWALRRQAAQSLARMALPGRDDAVLQALEKAALGDDYALVREAAARALFAIHPRAAVRVLERLRDSDPEAQVQAIARELLEGVVSAPAAETDSAEPPATPSRPP